MLEVCKIQENLGGYVVWNFNQPVTIRPQRGWDYQCGYLTNSPKIYTMMNPKAEGFELEERQPVYDAAWDELLSNLKRKVT